MRPLFPYLSLILVFLTKPYAQNFSISGTIKDGSNGEVMIGATIFLIENYKIATTSNKNGFFSLSAPKGKYPSVMSNTHYKTINQQITLDKNTTANATFSVVESNPEELEITDKSGNQNVKSTHVIKYQSLHNAEILTKIDGLNLSKVFF